jgi:hypothetical protein
MEVGNFPQNALVNSTRRNPYFRGSNRLVKIQFPCLRTGLEVSILMGNHGKTAPTEAIAGAG